MSRSYHHSSSQHRSSDEVVRPRSPPPNTHGHCNAPGPSRQTESSPLIFHELDSKEYAPSNPLEDSGAQLLESLEKTVQELVKSRRREASLMMENQQLRMAAATQNCQSPTVPSSSAGRIGQTKLEDLEVPTETGRISQLPAPGSDGCSLEGRQISQVPNSASLMLPLDAERVCQFANSGPENAVNQLIDAVKSQTISELQSQAERLQTSMLALDECNQRLQFRLRLSSSIPSAELSDVSMLCLSEGSPDDRALRFRRRLLNTITQLLKDKVGLIDLIDVLQKEKLQPLLPFNQQANCCLPATCHLRQNEAVQLSKVAHGQPSVCNSQNVAKTGNNRTVQDLQTAVQRLTNENSHLRLDNKALIQENNSLKKRLEECKEGNKDCLEKFKQLSEHWNQLFEHKTVLEQEIKTLKSENSDLKKRLCDQASNKGSAKNVSKPRDNNECAALRESLQQHLALSVSDGQRMGSSPSLLLKRKALCREQPENELEEQASDHRNLPILEGSGRASRREFEHVKRDMEDNAELRCIEFAVSGEKHRPSDVETDSWVLSKKVADLQKDNAFLKEELEKCTKNNAKLEMAMQKMNKEKHMLEDYLHVVQKVTNEPGLEALQIHGARGHRSNTDMTHRTSDNRIRCAVTYDGDKECQQHPCSSHAGMSGFSKDNSLECHLNISQQLTEMQRRLTEEAKAERKAKSELEQCYHSSKRSRQAILQDSEKEATWRNFDVRVHSPGPSQHTPPANYCYNAH